MNRREEGFLLLTSSLGNPQRKPLTLHQLRTLAGRMTRMDAPMQDMEVSENCLLALGYRGEMAHRIVELLSDGELLSRYLIRGKQMCCVPITRVSPDYPLRLRQKLGLGSPGVLWTKGDASILGQQAVSLVGSREVAPENRAFAAMVGYQAAKQGYVLVSGNARGSDRIAQAECLANGGRVISIVADKLEDKPERQGMLYVSLEDYDQPFSAQRALLRNGAIHALGAKTFVAQCAMETGGTWSGTVHNLQHGWSSVFCFRDGSKASYALEGMGATLIGMDALDDFGKLRCPTLSLFDE